MGMPINPTPGSTPPLQPTGGQQQPPPTNYLDPTGAWQKFLGGSATPQEVQMFIQGMMKMFDVLFQQMNDAAQRSSQVLKEAETDEEE